MASKFDQIQEQMKRGSYFGGASPTGGNDEKKGDVLLTVPESKPTVPTAPESKPAVKNDDTGHADQADQRHKPKGFRLASCYLSPEDYDKYSALARAKNMTLSKLLAAAAANYAANVELTEKEQAVYNALLM